MSDGAVSRPRPWWIEDAIDGFGTRKQFVRRDYETEPGRADTDIVLLRDRRRGAEGGDLVMRVARSTRPRASSYGM